MRGQPLAEERRPVAFALVASRSGVLRGSGSNSSVLGCHTLGFLAEEII